MKYYTDAERDRPDAWAILLAGGDGTRLQSLTRKITGDVRPKQFCRLFGDRSLLGHTRNRLRPIFSDDRTVFVVTRDHETFYMEELADANASRVLTQPANRGTGVAIIVALLRILQYDADAVVAVFPSDHYFADEAAFAATVRSSLVAASKYTESVILIAPSRKGRRSVTGGSNRRGRLRVAASTPHCSESVAFGRSRHSQPRAN